MPDRDATLDEFLDAGDGQESDDSTAGRGSDAGDAQDGGTAPDGTNANEPASTPANDASPVTPAGGESADPAEATYRWTGEGARCDGCGSHVERLWRDDAGLVCEECKEW